MLVRDEQLINALSPIDFTHFPIFAFIRDVQQENASLPIDVTLSGIAILVSFEQL